MTASITAITRCGAVSPAFARLRRSEQRPCTLHPGHQPTVHIHRNDDGKVTARWTDPNPLPRQMIRGSH